MVVLACHIVFIRLITATNFTWQQRCVLPAGLGEPLPYHWPIILKERDKVPRDVCTVRGYIGGCDVQRFVIVYNYFVCLRDGQFYFTRHAVPVSVSVPPPARHACQSCYYVRYDVMFPHPSLRFSAV